MQLTPFAGSTGTLTQQILQSIRHWREAPRIVADGINTPATVSVQAVRVDPPTTTTPTFEDNCSEMSWYRAQAGLPEAFDRIGYRESRCRNDVTSRTGCCFGWLQIYLASSMRAPGYRDGVSACGVDSVSDIRGDSESVKRAQMCVAKVMFDVSGMRPWT